MKLKELSMTEVARNFAHCVNQVHYQQAGFRLMKNGKAFAHLIPASGKICNGHDLAEAVGHVRLTAAESARWRKDLAQARKTLKSPPNKWQ